MPLDRSLAAGVGPVNCMLITNFEQDQRAARRKGVRQLMANQKLGESACSSHKQC